MKKKLPLEMRSLPGRVMNVLLIYYLLKNRRKKMKINLKYEGMRRNIQHQPNQEKHAAEMSINETHRMKTAINY